MNFVFLSPNFPKTYWHFTQSLKNNGVTTLGIGDEPYENLSQELKDSGGVLQGRQPGEL